ncbi:CapA family protein [Umezawaea sp. NPDC059074]|uniref:CapA family protein n=1 Tax=Umezawaea sp. NPDC059074 TaxID=3346716 RepID=UPI0036B34E38
MGNTKALGGLALAVSLSAAVLWTGFDGSPQPAADTAPTASVTVTDESGAPIAATVTTGGTTLHGVGPVRVPLGSGPALAVVSAPGFLAEPVPLGLEDVGRTVPVRLLSDHGGKRFVLHSAGDVMFGRRYQDAPALVPRDDAARGADHVVDAVAPAFRLGDLRTVNLETVLSAAPPETAYPGKRFILQSPPAATEGLKRLGVDVPSLANNHTRDFQDAGLADTTRALTAAGFPIVGLADSDRPQPAFHTRIRGNEVTMLAYTSVDGSFVNNSHPHDDTARHWGFDPLVPDAARTIGDAWRLFQKLEPTLTDAGPVWTSLTRVYPELQDWVAGRGHSGAAPWNPTTSPAEIAAAKRGLTVVQLHSGFQFQTASAKSTREMARAAIDAGADIVIGHHPHVLQGLEWYKGHLIAYSTGNLVFDQDFLATFSSAFLRTVWEGTRLVEARLVPVEIDGYRPAVSTGTAARRTVNGVWAASLLDAQTQRASDRSVVTTPLTRDADSRPAHFRFEHGTARISADAPPERLVPVTVPAHGDARIPFDGLVRPAPDGPPGLLVGRDLFGWGHFDDDTADGVASGATHWPASAVPNVVGGGTLGETGHLRLSDELTHPVARVTLHRSPGYSVRAKVRVSPGAAPVLRVASYRFDDSDPTEDPDSRLLRTVDRTIAVPADGGWHEVSFDLSPADLDADANMALLYAGAGAADLDDLEFVEWRPADGEWGPYDHVRNPGDTPANAVFHGLEN